MGVLDAPQWLLPAYVRSVRALGASAPVEAIGASGEALIGMWSTPDRHFHNLKHAIDTLARVDELADESHNPDVMRLAAWYHGCIFSSASEETYRSNGGEDEVASAAYAARDLHQLGLPDATVDRICALILNLKRHNLAANDIDAQALNDADLAILAVEPQQYKRYRQRVREEYSHIPDEDYLRARLAIITRLLDREMLFSSPLGARWERPARQNLQAEKQRLADELSRVRAAVAVDGDTARMAPVLEERPRSEARGGERRSRDEFPLPSTHVPRTRGAARADFGGSSPGRDAAAQRSQRAVVPVPVPEAVASRTSPASAGSPRTPAGGVEQLPPSIPPRRREEEPEHTTSMESCAADLDRILASRRQGVESGATADRAALVEAERAKLAERLRARTEAAKVLRKERTGEIAPITDPIVDDGAGNL